MLGLGDELEDTVWVDSRKLEELLLPLLDGDVVNAKT
jgi:hypothetical protein